jgi:hypothetical protein
MLAGRVGGGGGGKLGEGTRVRERHHREPEPLVRRLDRLEPCPGHEVSIENTIENLNHWFVGWTDWNLALDMK